MKLEAGKFYRTEDGRKAFVAAIDVLLRESDEPRALGYIEHPNPRDGNEAKFWFRDGRSTFDTTSLIDEWKEPMRIKGWMNIYKGHAEKPVGNVWPDKEICDRVAEPDRVACIPIDCLEGEGL